MGQSTSLKARDGEKFAYVDRVLQHGCHWHMHVLKLTLIAFIAFNEGRDDTMYADDEEYRPRSLSKELTYFEKVKQRCSPRPSPFTICC